MASVGLFTHNSTLLKMKQVEFINIINTHCPVFFHTEYLLHALIASSNENEDIAIVRKCMYNHLYRLEKQHLVKRLSPKRNRNALYEQQFSLQSPPQQPPQKMVNPLGKQSHKQDQLKNHYNVLQQHIKQLKQKHNAFKGLNDKFDAYSSIINRKLKVIDTELYAKRIELDAMSELMQEVRKEYKAQAY